MRSTNIILFLVLLNVAAGVTTAIAPGPVSVATGADAKIQGASSELGNGSVNEPQAGEVTGSILNNANILQTIDDVIFMGPNMLVNLGMPSIFKDGLLLVLGSIGVGYYMVQGSFAIPLIMFILVGGVTIVEAPLGVTQGIVAMMVIAIAGIGYALLQRVTV